MPLLARDNEVFQLCHVGVHEKRGEVGEVGGVDSINEFNSANSANSANESEATNLGGVEPAPSITRN